MTDKDGCDSLMPTQDALSQDISKIVQALGMSSECRRELANSNRDNSFEMHMNYQASLGPGGLLGSTDGALGLSQSNSQQENYLNQQGCGTALSDLKSIVDEQYKIACDINATSVTTDNQAVTNQTINISTNISADYAAELQAARENMESKRPERPSLSAIRDMISKGVSEDTAKSLYNLALSSYYKEIQAFNERYKTFEEPSIDASGATIENISNLKLKVVTSVSKSVRQKIIESVKNIAGTVATSEVSQKSGLGGSNDGLKSLISSNLESKAQDIDKTVNQISDSLAITVNSNQQIEISSNSGSINLKNTKITNNIAIDLLTDKFTKIGLDLGKEISSEIIKNAATDTSVSQESAGLEDVIKQVNEGLTARISALTKAQAEWKSAGKQNYTMYLILAGLVMGGGGIGTSGPLTPIKIIMLLILLYLVIALLFGWFPFSLFGMKLFGSSKSSDSEDPSNSSDSEDSREELRMKRTINYKKKPNILYKTDPNLASMIERQSSVKQNVNKGRQFLKTKTLYYTQHKNSSSSSPPYSRSQGPCTSPWCDLVDGDGGAIPQNRYD